MYKLATMIVAMKITKSDFDKLYDPDVSKREYDRIVELIDDRFYEIVKIINPVIETRGWFDYGNCSYDSEESNGYFDPKEYKSNISVGGEVCLCAPLRDNSFPTRWLWEDFEDEFRKSVSDHKLAMENKKAQTKVARERHKQEKAIAIESIRNKLTEEELKFVRFK